MPASSSTLTTNALLTSDDFIQKQQQYLHMLQKRIDENLASYKKLLATLEICIQKHFENEADALIALFSEEAYSKEVVNCARAAYFKNDKPERNPLFSLADNLSEFLATISESSDPMTIEFARQAILLTHDMFNHNRLYNYNDMENLSNTLIAATKFYKNPADLQKQIDFTNAVNHFAIHIDDRGKLDKFILKHPLLSSFIATALVVTAIISILALFILGPLAAGSAAVSLVVTLTSISTLVTGMLGVVASTHVMMNKERQENPFLALKDQKVDNILASLKNCAQNGFFSSAQKQTDINEREEPLLSQSEDSRPAPA